MEQKIVEEWAASGDGGRLTRTARAAMLGVSIATLKRILNREGNDKAVLIEAFTAVNLDWDEAFCESENPDRLDSVRNDVSSLGNPGGKRRWSLRLGLVALIIIGLVGSGLIRSQVKVNEINRLHKDVVAVIEAGRQDYWAANYPGAIRNAKKAISIAKKSRSMDAGADAQQILGDSLAVQGKLKEAADCYQTCVSMWKAFEDKKGVGICLELQAVNQARMGELDQAETNMRASRAPLLEVNNGKDSPGILRGLGSISAVRGDYGGAREWYSQAMALLTKEADEPMMTDIAALQALILRDKGEYDEALRVLRKCLGYWESHGQQRWIATTRRQIATVYFAAGRNDRARVELGEAITLFESVGDEKNAGECVELRDKGLGSRIEDYF